MEPMTERPILRQKYQKQRTAAGQLLRTLRLAQGWTLKDVIARHPLRVRVSYIADLERGMAPIKTDVIVQLARVYGLDAGALAEALHIASQA